MSAINSFLCCKCKQLFYGKSGSMGECPYCKSVYFAWIDYPDRSKKEIENLLKEVKIAGSSS